MGVWGAAQAIAQGFGGFAGAALVDALRLSGDTADCLRRSSSRSKPLSFLPPA